MLSAIRKSDQKKVTGRFIQKRAGEQYFCPECGSEVIHHRSASGIVIGHFKHRAGSPYCAYEGESPLHMAIKAQLKDHISDNYPAGISFIEEEYRGLGGSLRPDVFLKTRRGKSIAFEVQVSPITIDEITRRTREYLKKGVHMFWLLPWDASRFYEERPEFGWTHENGQYIKRVHKEPSGTLRLTEHEVFLYWSGFKNLVFWDTEEPGFILCSLDESYSNEREFMLEGEERKHKGIKQSMVKRLVEIRRDVPFTGFNPTYVKAFRSRTRPYPIPPRLVMLFRG